MITIPNEKSSNRFAEASHDTSRMTHQNHRNVKLFFYFVPLQSLEQAVKDIWWENQTHYPPLCSLSVRPCLTSNFAKRRRGHRIVAAPDCFARPRSGINTGANVFWWCNILSAFSTPWICTILDPHVKPFGTVNDACTDQWNWSRPISHSACNMLYRV